MEKNTKYWILAIAPAIFNSVPSGLVVGAVLYTIPDTKRQGKIGLIVSIVTFVVTLIGLTL